ncbi:MAG: DUF1570 domain-containing protein [Planctomycetaceae bacterium]|nr:MAG: DUF1570 domain-containing protein [Planctomycetaceae bacterium]
MPALIEHRPRKPLRPTDAARLTLSLVAILTAFVPAALRADEPDETAFRIRYQKSADQEIEIVGKPLVTAQDGGQMILTDAGQLRVVQPESVLSREQLAEPFTPIDAEEMSRRLLAELPPGFAIHRTKNYLIAHNTFPGYVRWVGILFESLHRGFHSFFRKERWPLEKPRFPLVALVFADRASFDEYARTELGNHSDTVIGYYNLETNRMITFYVPDPERNVATLVHEATHQLAYNTGLQTRFADNPMWVSEGLAVFFESPHFANPAGWQGAGRVNRVNLERFRDYQQRRPGNSLAMLLCDDARFRDPTTAGDAYAEAWALTYFLIRSQKKAYIDYLRELSRGKPLVERDRRERVALFESKFDTDLETLDRKFLAFMRTVQ